MRRRIGSVVGLLAVVVFAVSCGDDTNRPSPTAPSTLSPGPGSATIVGRNCPTLASLVSLAHSVFDGGSPNAASVLVLIADLDLQLRLGKLSTAQTRARTIISTILLRVQQKVPPDKRAQVQALISGILCYAGLSPDTFLVLPTDGAQVFRTGDGNAGISLDAGSVAQPTTISITPLPVTTPPLDTKLDQYPGFIEVTESSPLSKPAVIGVCPASNIPADVLARLRLGHQATTGFEITPAADASFLDCSTSTAQSRIPEWVHRLASLFMPTPLYAKPPFAGGIGGLASEFSPFAPVDPVLSLSGGIGGTATEFQRKSKADTLKFSPNASMSPTSKAPLSSSKSLSPTGGQNTVVNGTCTAIDAVAGTVVETECRPVITLKTFQGTILTSVPVGWAIGLGGGIVAPEVTVAHTCGDFAASAATATDANGNASVCWTLGGTPGANTVIATPTAGGDTPPGVTFSPAAITFSATANPITPTAGATGGQFVYDGLPHSGSGTCSNGLTPALSFSGDGTTPTNVGSYTVTVTCGAGNPLYVTVTQPATIGITPAVTTAAISCPTAVEFTGAALTPCTASVSGPGNLQQAVIPTYTANVAVGTVTATAAFQGGGNYQPSSATATFQITPAHTMTAVSCPVSVPFTGAAQTPCSATTTGPQLNTATALTYSANVNAGTATASATYAGGGNYQASGGSATFAIAPASTVAAVSCPDWVFFTGYPVGPCTGSVTGPGLSQSLTPTYTLNLYGLVTATVNYPGGGNYLASTAAKTFRVLFVQSGCFAAPLYGSKPSTNTYQKKGSSFLIKCLLHTDRGDGVHGAHGALIVQDLGRDGLGAPITVLSLADAFNGASDGTYSYGLSTSSSGFASSHYYLVTATWSDGSTSTGFFYVK